MVLQNFIQAVSLKVDQQRRIKVSSQFFLPLVFSLLALSELNAMLVLSQNVKVMSSWREERENYTEGMFLGQD